MPTNPFQTGFMKISIKTVQRNSDTVTSRISVHSNETFKEVNENKLQVS